MSTRTSNAGVLGVDRIELLRSASLRSPNSERRGSERDENFELVQRWLVDSLSAWLADVQNQCQSHEGNEFSVVEDDHRAQAPQEFKVHFQEEPVNGITSTRMTGMNGQASSFQELLMKLGYEHHTQLEELRAENESIRELVRQQVSSTLSRKGAAKTGGPVNYEESQNFGMMAQRTSSGPPGIKEAVQEACAIYLKDEATQPESPSQLEFDGIAGEFWAPNFKPMEPDMGAVEASGLLAVKFNETNQGEDLAAWKEVLSASMPIEEHMSAKDMTAVMTMENDMKKKAGTLCALFGDSTLLSASCFHVWSSLTKQMRRTVNFPLRDAWIHEAPKLHTSSSGSTLGTTVGNMRPSTFQAHSSHMHGGEEEEEILTSSRFSFLIIHPGSFKRLTWDLMGAVLLFSDLVLIPMQAFSPEWGLFTILVDWTTLVFWSLDMLASCMTGFMFQGVTVMQPKYIAINYLKTWFILDAIVVFPDWVFSIIELMRTEGGDGSQEKGKFLRALKMVRVVRILRLVKIKRIAAMVRDRFITSEMVFIVCNIVKLILLLLCVNHFLASIWYLIGSFSHDLDAPNWIESDQGFYGEPLGYRYTTALHWSLTQFTPASMSVQPQNVVERTFAVAVLVFGLVLFSSFISNITTSMTQLRSMQDDKTKQFWLVRRYLRQHSIQTSLTFRILRFLEYACREQKDLVPESRVWVLNLLSDQLKSELQYVVSYSCMMNHPLFEHTSHCSNVTMHRLGSSGLSQQSLAASDLLFNAGSVATQMHVIVSGDIQYVKADHMDEASDTLQEDDWLCEPTLWTHWVHLGSAKATTECKLVSINEKEMEVVIKMDVAVWELVMVYARNYVIWLNGTLRGKLTDSSHCEAMRPLCRNFLFDDDDEDGLGHPRGTKRRSLSRHGMGSAPLSDTRGRSGHGSQHRQSMMGFLG